MGAEFVGRRPVPRQQVVGVFRIAVTVLAGVQESSRLRHAAVCGVSVVGSAGSVGFEGEFGEALDGV